MSEFTFLIGGRDRSASPDQIQKTMQKWVEWFKELGANGHLKVPGHPLAENGKVVRPRRPNAKAPIWFRISCRARRRRRSGVSPSSSIYLAGYWVRRPCRP
jgi:hypothetical protein